MTHFPKSIDRRQLLRLAAGAAALPLSVRTARAQSHPAPQLSEGSVRPLAERLAAYVDGLRYEDLDGATIERIKMHLIELDRMRRCSVRRRPGAGLP